MDDPDLMDEQERQDFYTCQWNRDEPEIPALSFGEDDERLPIDCGSF